MPTRKKRGALEITTTVSATGFDCLPAELRNRIYELTLIPGDRAAVRITSGMDCMSRNLGLGLLGTCKLIRQEAVGIYYGCNSFRIDVIKLCANPNKGGLFPYYGDVYDPRLKTYEEPLNAFIAGTNFGSKVNKAFGLKSIRKLEFAYFVKDPFSESERIMKFWDDSPLLPDEADVVATLSILECAPWFAFGWDAARSTEKSEGRLADLRDRMLAYTESFALREQRTLVRDDLVHLADRFYYSCINADIGE